MKRAVDYQELREVRAVGAWHMIDRWLMEDMEEINLIASELAHILANSIDPESLLELEPVDEWVEVASSREGCAIVLMAPDLGIGYAKLMSELKELWVEVVDEWRCATGSDWKQDDDGDLVLFGDKTQGMADIEIENAPNIDEKLEIAWVNRGVK